MRDRASIRLISTPKRRPHMVGTLRGLESRPTHFAGTRVATVKISCHNAIARMYLIFMEFFGAAKRIRTPEPRITNSQIDCMTYINQNLANAKRDLRRLIEGKICLCMYKSRHSSFRQ
jgi:hypothetical protein